MAELENTQRSFQSFRPAGSDADSNIHRFRDQTIERPMQIAYSHKMPVANDWQPGKDVVGFFDKAAQSNTVPAVNW